MKSKQKTVASFSYTLTIALPVLFLNAYSNNPLRQSDVNSWIKNSHSLRFTENKGQFTDQNGNTLSSLLYRASEPGAAMYVTTRGLSYVFTEASEQVIPSLNTQSIPSVHFCRADVELEGAVIRSEKCIKEGESTDRNDYYLAHSPNGILNVHSYDKITFKDVYPGIDWVIYSTSAMSQENRLKYNFVVHPGADPSRIKFKYTWTDKPVVQKDGSMRVSTPMGVITEGIPQSYCLSDKKKISTVYSLQGDEVSFRLGPYDSKETLTIDPDLVWATYSNGTEIEDVFALNTDGTNVWVTGTSESGGIFPVYDPPGGTAYYKGTYPGGLRDIFIIEFSNCGQRLWATYYGGSLMDIANSICSDGTNVWVTGTTQSPDFPTWNSGPDAFYQGALGGGLGSGNVFLLEFSCTTNARIWASFYGGSLGDIGNSICSDGTSVWVTGYTSSTNFPTKFSGTAYMQNALGGAGTTNAFVLQFKCSDNSRVWGSYFGGSGYVNGFMTNGDEGNSINSDGKNIWVTGYTYSTDFPVQFPANAYHQKVPGATGVSNAFLLEFSCTTDALEWSSCYGGSGNDMGNSVSSDGTSVWVTGQAQSTDFPILNPGGKTYFQPSPGGTNNTFISQFSCTDNHLVWSTYYGGSNAGPTGDEGYSIQSINNNVWVCGATLSESFPTAAIACGFYQPTLQGTTGVKGGSDDVYILQFTTAGNLVWATYFGADSENDGSYISSDGTNLFVAGDAELLGYTPVNPGAPAFYEKTISSQENFFIGKFTPSLCSITVSPDTLICVNGIASLNAGGADSYMWTPSTGLSSTSGSLVSASPGSQTTYTVTGTSGIGCGAFTSATAYVTVKVSAITAGASQVNPVSCNGGSDGAAGVNAMGGTGMLTYSWSNDLTNVTSIAGLTAGTYTVTITDSLGCSAVSSADVRQPMPIQLTLTQTEASCDDSDGTALVNASGGNGSYSYQWFPSGGTGQTAENLSPGTYKIIVKDARGCSADSTVDILSAGGLHVTIVPAEAELVAGQQVMLTASGGNSYSWEPSAGLSGDTLPDPTASPTRTTTYTVTVKNSSTGCTATDTVLIKVNESGICDSSSVFVPDAFSPNNDGRNDIFLIQGTSCLSQMQLMIFNRWGEMVFETTDPGTGWDGTYNGKLQEKSVFIYYLKCTFVNGQKVIKKGNLTMLR